MLLLPHGYEGQGPDHSSARLERFLQLAAEDAFTVAQPSTPANYFHMLRQQALGELHRPLIVMTPKSMLRNKLAVSDPSDFTQGSWKPVLGDPTIEDPSKVTSVLLCSGKIRWDLVNARSQAGKDGQVAIIAVERLYPLPTKDLVKQLRRFDRRRGGALGARRAGQPGGVALHGTEPAAAAGRSRAGSDLAADQGDPTGIVGAISRVGDAFICSSSVP